MIITVNSALMKLLKTNSHLSAPSSRDQEQSATITSLQRRILEAEAETSAAKEQAATLNGLLEELKASAGLECVSAWRFGLAYVEAPVYFSHYFCPSS